jgi:indolepyruvate ferredoxin oxidoreductase beta subunit
VTAAAPALAARAPDPRLGGIIRLAVLAVGGQGGGVLTGWIEDLARANGFAAQATSVAGVAQRTGATIYYVEMAPQTGRAPVFALAPSAGDVDILIAAEMMEAGRAILRGFVTPDRTTLIASTHRMLAVSEKMVPGDGIASSAEVRAAAEVAAKRLIMADFEAAAAGAGSVISASLFGALAASGALPFPRAAFETAIRAGGKGVEASLRAFAAGFAAALAGGAPAPGQEGPGPGAGQGAAAPASPPAARGPERLRAAWERLAARVAALPAPVAAMAGPGLRRVVDFQDVAYGAEYLDRLAAVLAQDSAAEGWALSREAAKYLANAMAYDDVIGVADRKTRPARTARLRAEMGASGDTVMAVTEYFHPRAEEIVGLLPAAMGARWRANRRRMARIDRLFGRGRRLRSDRLLAFAMLWLIGGLRSWRRRTLRHAEETAHLEAWLARATAVRPHDYALAVEIIRCRRLVKGYSDTHARGLSKFDRVMAAIALVEGRPDAADWARRLREAALQDEAGTALEGAIATIRSFV